MLEKVNQVCINAACGQSLLLRVPYCPYCGTRQVAAPVPVAVPPPAPAPALKPAPRPAPTPLQPAPAPEAPPVAIDQPAPAKAAPPRPATARSVPPPRPPVRLRTWLLAAAALAGIWFVNQPADRPASVADQVKQAGVLVRQCDLDGARAVLAQLKAAKAPTAQVKQVQADISSAVTGCGKQQRREQARAQLTLDVAQALDAGKPALAATRLAAHVKRWGDDPDTLELDARIKVALASAQLDAAEACLARADHGCAEKSLLAAERYKRPELAARIQALRSALSALLEKALLDAPAGQ